ncbi:MAG: hypothetical protein R2737_16710 [Candidatus Nanopelagicales bacterium]
MAEPTSDQPVSADSGGEYEDLPFPELRERAFKLAEKRHDLGFFVDLYSHMPGMVAMADEGGDLGAIGGSIIESIRAAREMMGDEGVGPELEPLLRARFATYLREHEDA